MLIIWKKYKNYFFAILGLILSVVVFVLFYFLRRNDTHDTDNSTTTLAGILKDTSEKMTEAEHVAAIESAIAKTKEDSVKEELVEIQKTEDAAERRKQLLFLHNRVRGQ